jgi:hypothetical protein
VFLGVGVAAVAAAAAGPIYLASADQSVLQSQLASQPAYVTGVTISSAPGAPAPSPATLTNLALEAPGGSGGKSSRFGAPIVTLDVSAIVFSRATQLDDGIELISRTDDCAALRIVAGACPAKPDQVMISTRSAAALDARVGSHIRPLHNGIQHGKGPALQVSGLYQAPATLSAYWWGSNLFAFGAPFGPLGSSQVLDAGFVTQAGAQFLATSLPMSDMAQLSLRANKIAASQIPAFLASLTAYGSRLAPDQLSVASRVTGLLGGVEGQERQMKGIVSVVALELVLLALLVLYGVASANSAERGPDLAIAELRGLRRRSIAAIALREPVLLLALATPTGLVAGWAIVRLLSPRLFAEHIGVGIDSLAIAAALATFLAGLGAAAIGARTLLRPSLAGESRTASARRAARAAGLADAIAVVLAIVAVVELVSGKAGSGDLGGAGSQGSTASNPLGALAPALVGLVAGVAGARLLPLAARSLVRATRTSPKVATALASRSVMRRPGLARRVLVPAIAVGLLVFSVAGYKVAQANRATQAEFTVGAPIVLKAHVNPGVDLVEAVRQADPSGREAMAVTELEGPSGDTLAVDSSRFAAVAAWPPGTSSATASQVASYLAPPTAPPLILKRATEIRLAIDLTAQVKPSPILQMSVYDETGFAEDVLNLGTLTRGQHVYTVPAGGACADSCRVDAFTVFWAPGRNSAATETVVPLRLSSFQIRSPGGGPWREVGAGFSGGSDWIGSTPQVTSNPSPSGLVATYHVAASGTPPALQRNDTPPLLPAVVTSSLVSSTASLTAPNQFPAVGLGGDNLTVVSTIHAGSLPSVGATAVLVDLSLAERLQSGPPSSESFQVWCRKPPPASLVRRLGDLGVTITGSTSSAALLGTLNHSGPALAFDLFVLSAIAAGLLALGALVFAVASASRRRAVEFAALAAVGIPRGVLRRSLLGEYWAIVGAGVVLGLISGLATIRLALDTLPEFVPGRVGPALTVWIPWGPVLLASGLALGLLLLGTTLATTLVMRRITPECLRVAA